jgi:cation:H+ antiporter
MLALGLLLLLVGGTGLVTGASGIAKHHGVSPLVVGLTVVAFGTSAPELVVNIMGALRGETELAFGNVAGSNLANLGLVLGTAALIRPMTIEGQIVRRELPLLLLGTTILMVMTLDEPLQGTSPILSRSDGMILLLLFSVFIYITIGDFMLKRPDPIIEHIREFEEALPTSPVTSRAAHWLFVAAGIAALGAGGQLTIVNGATLAESLGVSPVIVGLLVVAVGTSMPELVTSMIAAFKNESDLCVGNVVGSNLFNSLVVLPISALVRPLPIPPGGLMDIFMSLAFAAILIPVFFYGRALMDKKAGVALILCYVIYMIQRVAT